MDRSLAPYRLVLLVLAAAVAGAMVARIMVRESNLGVLGHAVALLAVAP